MAISGRRARVAHLAQSEKVEEREMLGTREGALCD